MTNLSNLERRRLQGEIVKPIYDELVDEIGKEAARDLISRAVTKSAQAEAKLAAAFSEETSLTVFAALFNAVYRDPGGDASGLDIEPLHEDETRLDFNVTRCRFMDMYAELGLSDIADVLSCNRDGEFAGAFDNRIKLTRDQTIAGGAQCCTFRFRQENNHD
ncbi:MAG: L-2-amino-thiazoline-4-carboxylic acid hydrolase [Hyphomonadaceae bacterium]